MVCGSRIRTRSKEPGVSLHRRQSDDRADRLRRRALMAERRVVAVVSGGLDSTTMAYSLRAQGYALVAISFDYGQRHRKELAFAEQMAADLDAPWTLIDLHAAGVTSFLTGSALTDESVTVPDGHYADESM